MARIWEKFITERDKKIFGAAGFAQRMSFGKRPALLNIDFTYSFCGDKPEPLLEAVKRWPLSSGEEAWRAVDALRPLLAAARRKALPIFYTVPVFRYDAWDAGSWMFKGGRIREDIRTPAAERGGKEGGDVVAEVAPEPRDIVVPKIKPSGFHGTALNSFLQLHQVDTIILTGGTTSGCLRASVVDAFNENYRVIVAEECCFDRSETSHAINLMDMNAKYADVIATSEVIEEIGKLPDGLFTLPDGR